MPVYSEEELEQIPEVTDLDDALRSPERVIRFCGYQVEDARKLARVIELRNLQSLSLSLSAVGDLLPRLGEMDNLQVLYLQACSIATFPEAILNLRNLRSLAMGNNSLESLPNEIGKLQNLNYLGFSQNNLKRLADSVGDLLRLKTLVLSYNRIEELPASIAKLVDLEYLFLHCNRLRTLPEAVCSLAKLESLTLQHNHFELLPPCLTRMASLQKVTIEAGKRSLYMDWTYEPSKNPARIELKDMGFFVTPSSSVFGGLSAAIEESKLSEFGPVIWSSAREAVKIETTYPDDYSELGNSRFGGFPDLEEPGYFPRTDGLYWIFLAQLNLADLAPLNKFLPRSGLLSFFIDSTEELNLKRKMENGVQERGELI